MKKSLLGGLLMGGLLFAQSSMAQSDYPTLTQIKSRVQSVASNSSAELITLTKTAGGEDIQVLKIGTGNLNEKPAIAVVGGVEGFHVLSVELALQFAESLIDQNKSALDKTTFYVFPNMSPDAYKQYHASLKYERRGNAASVDHDRDGTLGDNGYTDLNGDGLITWMRVEDPTGDYIISEEDDRVMVKADRSAGQSGQYAIYMESKDDDKDGMFAEDLSEGIAFNKSLTYKFPVFEPLAGDIPVSQPESRAMLDFLFDQWNIFAFVTFSPANNLSSPLSYNAGNARKRVLTSILEEDQKINKMVSDQYKKTVSQKAYGQNNQGTDGDFFQWAYFHFGRLSFGTPGYWTPEFKDAEGKGKSSPEANYLAWADSLGWNDVFVPWTPITHPDFPGKKVEVGGIKPFVMANPPFDQVEKIATEHADFILALADMQPKLELHNLKVEDLGNGLSRVSMDLFNNAPLPTHSELGERSRWLRKIRVDMGIDKDRLISGDATSTIDVLGAYEKVSMSWVVRGKGAADLKVGAAHLGFINEKINL